MTSLLPLLEVVPVEASEMALTLALRAEGRVRGLLEFKRGKKRLTAYAYTGQELLDKYTCSRGSSPPSCLEQLAADLAEELGYAASVDSIYQAILEAYEKWDDLAEAAKLERLKNKLESGFEPILSIEVDGVLVDVLASDGVEMPGHGGYVEAGECVGIAETTYAYTEQASRGEGLDRRIDLVGILMAYKRVGDSLKLEGGRFFLPRIQSEIDLCGRPVRLRKPAARAILGAETLPRIELFREIRYSETSLGLEEWRSVGAELLERLGESVFHRDKRVYAVLASYAAMTYFYDLFTAVPFLWFYGPPGSGKTRANMTVTFMSRRGVFVANPSSASLYRLADSLGGTIGVDESALTRDQKLILASSYKGSSKVPRVEQTRSGFVLKLFSSVAPRVFSFIDLPEEDYLRQRIIAVPMEKGKPQRSEDPLPGDYADLRDRLYRLRLLGLPVVLQAKERASTLLDRCGVEGRDREVWWPLLTAALLLGVEREVVDYMLEDLREKTESEDMYAAERTVLGAMGQLYAESSDRTIEGERVLVFTAADLQRVIVNEYLREEDCLELAEGEAGEAERVKQDCRRRAEELRKQWSPQRIGRILERMGLSKYKRKAGKGSGARRVYRIPQSVYEQKLRLYGAPGSVESVKSVKCLEEGTSNPGLHTPLENHVEERPNIITSWLDLASVPLPQKLDRLGRLDRPLKS